MIQKSDRTGWSPETQRFTLQTFDNKSFDWHPDGYVRMKHWDGRTGGIAVGDAVGGRIVIHVDETDTAESFSSIEDAVEAGWAID